MNKISIFFYIAFSFLFTKLYAQEAIIDGLKYEIDSNSGKATLVAQDKDLSGAITIPSYVFYNSTLYSVKCSEGAFKECENITQASLPENMSIVPSKLFYRCTSLESITLPTYLSEVGDQSFGGCTKLNNVVIPSTVTAFGNMCFADCTSLTQMTCYADTPPSCNCWAFYGGNCESGTLLVDGKNVETYQKTDGWKIWGEIKAIPGTEPVVPEEEKHDTVYVEVEKVIHDTVFVEKVVEVEKIVEKIVEIEKIVEVEKIVEKLDTIYITQTDTLIIYDDSRSNIALPNGNVVTLSIIDGVIHIQDAPIGAEMSIYSESGLLVKKMTIEDFVTIVEIPRNALYIVKIGNKTIKLKM